MSAWAASRCQPGGFAVSALVLGCPGGFAVSALVFGFRLTAGFLTFNLRNATKTVVFEFRMRIDHGRFPVRGGFAVSALVFGFRLTAGLRLRGVCLGFWFSLEAGFLTFGLSNATKIYWFIALTRAVSRCLRLRGVCLGFWFSLDSRFPVASRCLPWFLVFA